MSQPPVVVNDASAHFRGAVRQAVQNQGLEVTPASCEYLSSLLARYTSVAVLPVSDADVRFLHRPLGEIFADAEAARGVERLERLRALGDLSLWVSGYWTDALERRLVGVDYYVAMGGHAYQRIAMDLAATGRQALFDELARKFARFVDVLSEVSARDAGRAQPTVLRLYERWQKTQSRWAARALAELGIVARSGHEDDDLQ
jgi:hypothetical protein